MAVTVLAAKFPVVSRATIVPEPFALAAFDVTVNVFGYYRDEAIESLPRIAEEYDEFCHALVMRDDVEQLDACMDMIWVILGFCHMKGFDVTGAWDEVMRSNMAKVDRKTGKVIRREDGKILKPEGWTPPDLTKFVKKP